VVGWDLSVVDGVVLVVFVEVITVVSSITLEPLHSWYGVVINLTSVDISITVPFINMTKDSVKTNLVADDGFIDLWSDQMLLQQNLDEEDIPVGLGGELTELNVLAVDVTEDGVVVQISPDNRLVNLWSDHIFLEEDLEEELVLNLLLDWDVGQSLLHWVDGLLNLNIDNFVVSGDELDIGLDLGQILVLVSIQVPVDFFEKVVVVVSFWPVLRLAGETVVVGIWEGIFVPVDIISALGVDVLGVLVLVAISVGGGVLRMEQLDLGINVLVEHDGV